MTPLSLGVPPQSLGQNQAGRGHRQAGGTRQAEGAGQGTGLRLGPASPFYADARRLLGDRQDVEKEK